MRERRRSAYTLGLVMVVLAMTLALLSMESSIMAAVRDAFRTRFGTDVTAFAPGPLDDATRSKLAHVDGVAATTTFGFGNVKVADGRSVSLLVVDGSTFFDLQGFPWVEGERQSAQQMLTNGGGVVVPEVFAQSRKLHKGSTLALVATDGTAHPFKIAGVYRTPEPQVRIVVGVPDATRYFGGGAPSAIAFRAKAGVPADALKGRLERALGNNLGFLITTSASEEKAAAERVQRNFQPFLAVVLVAAVVGMLGLANTLGMSILRRTRELGVLRAVGIARRDLAAMVLVEALTMGVVACALAIPIGWMLTVALLKTSTNSLGFIVAFKPPWLLLPATVIAALAIASIAAVGPARRVSRLDPVVALRFE